ncbi:2-Hydroxyacid oxidase 2-like [Glandiceps talaboti]
MANQMLCVEDYEHAFKQHLNIAYWAYFTTGCDEEITLKENREAFKRLRIRPRMLQDVSVQDLSTSLLGNKIDFPIGIAPTSFHVLVHPKAEVATANASKAMNTCMILSQHSSTSLEKVAEDTPNGLKWANLYLFKDREITRDMVKRIESHYYKGIVVSIDNPSVGKRIRSKRHGYIDKVKTSPPGNGSLDKYLKGKNIAEKWTHRRVVGFGANDPAATWEYIDWLRSLTSLPIILKGIQTAEDANLGVQHGANAIIVSNHGGRALDSGPATIEALPEIVRAVGDKTEVYLDGGIRTGNDVFKALALGAKAVFVGRPPLYGLAHSGEEGVKHILQLLKEELLQTMAFAGCRVLSDITPSSVVHASLYAKL